jgi:hypothetical protein
MKRIKLFESFIKETAIDLPDPSTAGEVFAGVLAGNKNAKEEPKGSNTGSMVNQYLSSVGLKPGLPWCAAFVYYIFDQVTKRLHVKNQLPKTGGVMNMWKSSDPSLRINIADAKANPSLIKPGQIFIMSRPGKGLGHTGIVIGVDLNKREFISIEGNTNDQQSGEGDRVGVNRRKIDKLPLLGFIDYFKNERTPEFEKDIMSAIDKSKIPLSPLDGVPTDAVVSGYEEDPGGVKSKPAGFLANVLAGLAHTASGKVASADEIEAQLDKLR